MQKKYRIWFGLGGNMHEWVDPFFLDKTDGEHGGSKDGLNSSFDSCYVITDLISGGGGGGIQTPLSTPLVLFIVQVGVVRQSMWGRLHVFCVHDAYCVYVDAAAACSTYIYSYIPKHA